MLEARCPPTAARGGLQRAWGLFGEELDGLMAGMNEELVA
jgi:type I restriction enzyme R subunit